ncbi:MAG: hypothetical protein JW844_00565 [Candidatus Omnitrophica bacterium]|nr:hypothetical protein [Candidatus Omnitrophota bacterium]
MKMLLSLLILLALGFIGSRLSFSKIRFPLFSRYFFLSGDEYILLGLALGPSLFNVVDAASLVQLSPLVSLLLGWIGFLFGLQFQHKKLRYLPKHYFTISLAESLGVCLFLYAVFYLVCVRALHITFDEKAHVAIIALAAIGSVSGPTSIAIFQRDTGSGDNDVKLLQFISSLDGVVAICIFGVVFSWLRPGHVYTVPFLNSLEWFTLSLILGILFAMLLRYLVIRSRDVLEIEIMTLGVLIFSGGLCGYLRISPLFVNFICGVTLANLPILNKDKIYGILARIEQPFYITLLLLAGCLWELSLSLFTVLIAALFVFLRIIGKVVMLFGIRRVLAMDDDYSSRIGFGLIAQGGLAIAMILNVQQVYAGVWVSAIVTIVLAGILVNQLISIIFLKKFFGVSENA